jgi:uncharacterized membrane protein (GlpM family)
MKHYFLAFEYFHGQNTTSGEVNSKTGRYDIAGQLEMFPTTALRDEWIAKDTIKRKAVTRKQARKLRLGMPLPEYKEMLDAVFFHMHESLKEQQTHINEEL